MRLLLPKCEFIVFEPNFIHNKAIVARGFKNIINVVLASREKKVTWYGNGSTGDSIFRESLNPKYTNFRTVFANSLDNLYKDNKLGSKLPDLIKLDTQGSEIEILKGAAVALKNAKFVIMEMPIMVYNHNAPLFREYVEFMLINGFLPFSVIEEHRMHNVLIQINCAFINKNLVDTNNDRFIELTNKFYNIPSQKASK